MYRYFFIMFFLISCSLPRQASLDEMLRVKRLVEEARVKMNIGEIDQAESLVHLAEEVSANDPLVVDALGCLSWHRKDYDLAESYFRKAIFLDPRFENSYLNLAIVMEQKGEIAQAKSLLQKVLQINPFNHKARNNYAGIIFDYAISARDKEFARRELSKAINSAPEIDRVLKYNIDKFNRSRARIN